MPTVQDVFRNYAAAGEPVRVCVDLNMERAGTRQYVRGEVVTVTGTVQDVTDTHAVLDCNGQPMHVQLSQVESATPVFAS
jgi:hypothetical protein